MKKTTKWLSIILGVPFSFLVLIMILGIIAGPAKTQNPPLETKKVSEEVKIQENNMVPSEEVENENRTNKVENMSLDEKKRIYAEYIYAQRAAWEETLKLFPPKKQMENMAIYLKYDSENREKHYREVAMKNNLLRDELTAIVMQANSEMWEMPE